MKKSIKQIYLWGGLGNVLYQINLAYYLHENGYEVFVNKGLLDYDNKLLRNSIKIHKGVYKRVDLFIDSTRIGVIDKLKHTDYFYMLMYKMGINFKNFRFFNHDWPNDIEILKVNNFLGYFQKTRNISYQLGFTFRTKFKPKLDKELLSLVNLDSTILIHARFGDKLDVNQFDVSYNSLFHIFKSFESIVIVTDDVKNASLLSFNSDLKFKIIVVCSEDLVDDFYLISSAKTVVISRSSFSWWATEISISNQKIFQPSPLYIHVDWESFSNKNRIGFES